MGDYSIFMKTFKGGFHVKDHKELTRNSAIEQMPIVLDYWYSMNQHIGSPAIPVVAVGDHVKAGQLIAKANGVVSSNVFASVSGEVVEIVKKQTMQGRVVDHLHIKASSDQTELTFEPLKTINAGTIVERIEQAGIVGLGGAGFPTAVKLSQREKIDTLIVNAAECEPYLNCDNRLLIERCEKVVSGARLVAHSLGVSNVIFGIEQNKPLAIENLLKFNDVKVEVLKKKYPQGAEKALIYACTKRKVPTGGLPARVGVVVVNVATVHAVYEAVVENKPLIRRVMTVSGDGIKNPKNIEVRTGTPVEKIIEFCGGLSDETVKIIAGGPMMGFSFVDLSCSTSKTDSGLLALTAKQANVAQPTNCINCSRCAQHCPMHLEPMYIDFYAHAGEFETAVKYGALDCFECGTCAYVCPAKRPLVMSVRLTKAKMREKK